MSLTNTKLSVRGTILILGALLIMIGISTLENIYVYAHYPPYQISSIAILVVLVIIYRDYSIMNVVSIAATIIAYPLLVPLISVDILGAEHFTYRGVQFETTTLANKTTFLGLLFFLLYIGFIKNIDLLFNQEIKSNIHKYNLEIKFDAIPFLILSVVHLLAAYFSRPGPTILTANYYNSTSGTEFVFLIPLYIGSWIIMFLSIRKKRAKSSAYVSFVIMTILTVSWHLLHGKRLVVIGIPLVLMYEYTYSRDTDINSRLLISLIVTLGLTFVGRARTGSTSLDFVRGEFAYLPGGAQAIYGTFQSGIYIFDNYTGHLGVQGGLKFLIKFTPTNILEIIGISSGSVGDILSQYYGYGNPSFVLSSLYGIFSFFGILIGALLISVIASVANEAITDNRQDIISGCGFVTIYSLFPMLWYHQIAIIRYYQGFIICLLLYVSAYAVSGINRQGSVQSNDHD